MHSDNQHWETEVCLLNALLLAPLSQLWPTCCKAVQNVKSPSESAASSSLLIIAPHHPQPLLSLSHHLLPLFLPSSGECCNWYATGNKSAQLQGRAVPIIWTDRFSCFERKGEGERVYPAQLTAVTYSSLLYQGLDFFLVVDSIPSPPPHLRFPR